MAASRAAEGGSIPSVPISYYLVTTDKKFYKACFLGHYMNENDLIKLSKIELIKVINSYKDKLSSMEEYMNVIGSDSGNNSF